MQYRKVKTCRREGGREKEGGGREGERETETCIEFYTDDDICDVYEARTHARARPRRRGFGSSSSHDGEYLFIQLWIVPRPFYGALKPLLPS